MKKFKNVVKVLKTILLITTEIFVIFYAVWFIASYGWVLAHNLSTGYEIPNWNLFAFFLKMH